jgi:hypothetical protein
MACSIGAVMAVIGGYGGVFGDVPPDELAELVRDAVRGVLVPDENAQTALSPGRAPTGTIAGAGARRTLLASARRRRPLELVCWLAPDG